MAVAKNGMQAEFHRALWQGLPKKIEKLILQGADIHATEEGWPPIVLAASGLTNRRSYQVKCMEVLIKHGADIHVQHKTRLKTALMSACMEAREPTVCNKSIQCLVKHRVNIHQQDAEGKTALMYAARGHCVGNALFLIQQGVEINLQDHQGDTALMHALKYVRKGILNTPRRNDRALQIIQALIDQGVDSSITNNQGYDVIQIAEKMEHHVIADFIRCYSKTFIERDTLLNVVNGDDHQSDVLRL